MRPQTESFLQNIFSSMESEMQPFPVYAPATDSGELGSTAILILTQICN